MTGKKRGPEACKCDGYDTTICFNCPYPDCKIRSDYAVRGGIGKEIEDALGCDKPAYQKAQRDKERDAAYYQARRRAILDRQNELRQRNREQLGEEQAAIREARKRRGWTQEQLAVQCGVGQYTISAWECGTAPADWDKIRAVFPELREKQ